MIIKANRHSNPTKLASYLMSGGKHGERVEAPILRSFSEAENIFDAFRDIEILTGGTKAENPFLHVQIRLPGGEQITREQWEQTADRTQKRLGLDGQPRADVYHVDEKTGERHLHLALSLIDEQTMQAKPLPFFKYRLKALARELENEFEITRVTNEREGPVKYAATKNEERQAQRLGFDKEAIRNTIRACHDHSDCGRSFDDALADQGLILAQGTRRDYVVVDPTGGIHALGKRILGISAGQLRDKLADLDRDNIPTIQQARELMLDLPRDRVDALTRELSQVQEQIKAEAEYARRDPVREEMEWHDAVAKAAIAKEKQEGQFIAPEDRHLYQRPEKEARAAAEWEITTPDSGKLAAMIAEGQKRQAEQQERQAAQTPRPQPPAPELGRTDGEIRLAYSQTGTGREFADAIEDRGLIAARMTEADAERMNKWERQRLIEVKELQEALLLRERFCDVSKAVTGNALDEQGRQPPAPEQQRPHDRYKAGELVIVDQWGGVHQLNSRNTGDTLKDRENHLRDIDLAPLMSVTSAQVAMKEFQQHRQEERRYDWQQKREEWARAAKEEQWAINPPTPERQSPGLFAQAATEATRDERTENLQGPAAKAWEAWRQIDPAEHARAFDALYEKGIRFSVRTDAQNFAIALDDKGISFAIATKDEAERSRREAEFAKEIGHYAPRFKEGEIVIITEPRIEHHRDGEMTEPRRVYKLDQSLADKFVSALDNRSQLQGIDATLKASAERSQQRSEERTAERMERAADLSDRESLGGKDERAPAIIAKLPARVASGAFSLGEQLTGLVFSIFGASKSPLQQERDNREGERMTDRSNAEADYKIDLANTTAARHQQEAQNEDQRRAMERDGRER